MDYWNWFLDYNGTSRRADGRYQTDVFTAEAVDFIQRSAARHTAPRHTAPRHAGQPGSRSEARGTGPAATEEPAPSGCRQPTGGDGGDGGHANAGSGGTRGAVPDAQPRPAHAGGSAPQPFFPGGGLPRAALAAAGARRVLRAVSPARRSERRGCHPVRHGGEHGSRHRPDPRTRSTPPGVPTTRSCW